MIEQLEQHEAFLRAIFDDPDADTPRLVYADWLDDQGFPDWAELIRVQCERGRADGPGKPPARGLGSWGRHGGRPLELTAADLDDPPALRERVVTHSPTWFGETRLAVVPGVPLGPDEVNALFDLPFTQQVTDWNLGGHVEEVVGGAETEDAGTFDLIEMVDRPVVTVRGVEALAAHPGGRRVRHLTLTYNRLDNDAARALARSKHLIRLERLDLFDGNRFRGQTWSELIERYGEKVVG